MHHFDLFGAFSSRYNKTGYASYFFSLPSLLPPFRSSSSSWATFLQIQLDIFPNEQFAESLPIELMDRVKVTAWELQYCLALVRSLWTGSSVGYRGERKSVSRGRGGGGLDVLGSPRLAQQFSYCSMYTHSPHILMFQFCVHVYQSITALCATEHEERMWGEVRWGISVHKMLLCMYSVQHKNFKLKSLVMARPCSHQGDRYEDILWCWGCNCSLGV